MKFCDYARISVESGSGGPGAISFRREKNIPFGGPDGGHGGNGGSVRVRATAQLVTLIDFKYKSQYRAASGRPGGGRLKAGEAGADLVLHVPIGTQLWVDGQPIEDLVRPGQECFLVKGGRGGRGNASFASSRNRTPRENTPGEPGQKLILELRLKVLADVGLIGLPNAGKSTLLGALTRAQPKIGAYPFTTLIPQLGTLLTEDYREGVLADLPGLVEGAHEGRGLGHRFLGHGERCRAIMHVVDVSMPDPLQSYHAVRSELLAYHPNFQDKPEVIVLSKLDSPLQTLQDQQEALRAQYHAVNEHGNDNDHDPDSVADSQQDGALQMHLGKPYGGKAQDQEYSQDVFVSSKKTSVADNDPTIFHDTGKNVTTAGKSDPERAKALWAQWSALFPDRPVFVVSAHDGYGVLALRAYLAEHFCRHGWHQSNASAESHVSWQ